MSKQQNTPIIPGGYNDFLRELKTRIRSARVKAILSVNRELITLYWHIGRGILEHQARHRWGAKVIDNLARDLRSEFPETTGFSSRNLKYMRAFAGAYPEESIVQQAVAQIPWGHNIVLIEKVKDPDQRMWYVNQTIENGWSRNVLVHQIEGNLYGRQASTPKITNFTTTLPSPQSELVEQTIKDPYNFEFLTLEHTRKERDLERGLLDEIRKFLLELGTGFAFMGNQYHLEVGGDDFYIDLLFYHHELRCLVAIDLKTGHFKPEYAGKMNFYLSALDDLVRHADDQPSVGIVLCKSKNKAVAEYAIRDLSKPIGISEYRLTHTLPERLAENLPSPDELERLIKTKSATKD